jgi:hypothetical protein
MKREKKPKLSDAERHKRFLETAREVEASDDPKDFDKAFDKVISQPRRPSPPPKGERGSSPTKK